MKIYLSGQFEDGLALCEVRERLQTSGCSVTSRWLDSAALAPATSRTSDPGAPARLAAIARQDIEDIVAADLVVVFSPPEACGVGRGGRHVETGYALALGKRVIVVGARGNVFHWLPEVTLLADWHALEMFLRGESRGRPLAELRGTS
jgi:nucleoside 2-deoxyribosyltransferase